MAKKLSYFFKHWRFIVHLLLKTRHFGVNNVWWSAEPSCLGWSLWQQCKGVILVIPIIRNYQAMKFRAFAGWIPKQQAKQLF